MAMQVFSQTLNERLLPTRLHSEKGNITAMDLRYNYDSRGNITRIYDGWDDDHDKTFGYQLGASSGSSYQAPSGADKVSIAPQLMYGSHS